VFAARLSYKYALSLRTARTCDAHPLPLPQAGGEIFGQAPSRKRKGRIRQSNPARNRTGPA